MKCNDRIPKLKRDVFISVVLYIHFDRLKRIYFDRNVLYIAETGVNIGALVTLDIDDSQEENPPLISAV